MKKAWLAPLLSALFFALFVGAWYLATTASSGGGGAAPAMDPEYAALYGF